VTPGAEPPARPAAPTEQFAPTERTAPTERFDRTALREQYRQQIKDSIGGWSGSVVAALPPVVFVAVNAWQGLWPAISAAIATAVLLVVYRLLRHEPLQHAFTGMFGVVVGALIAAWTGQARGYFLVGIVGSFVYGAVCLVTVLIRRPLVGLIWEFIEPTPEVDGEDAPRWYRRVVLLRAYDLGTAAFVFMFMAKGILQATLYQHNATGWLAVARIVMGFPFYIATVGLAFWLGRRARQSLMISADHDERDSE
jgi:hypothetical protein